MTSYIQALDFTCGRNEANVHSLPCKIHYNGEAEITEYFTPTKGTNENPDDLKISFRGFPLNGKIINIPQSFHGFLLKKGDTGKLEPIKSFDSMTYWEWDKIPSKNDSLISALDWLSLSSQVHDPVEDEELAISECAGS